MAKAAIVNKGNIPIHDYKFERRVEHYINGKIKTIAELNLGTHHGHYVEYLDDNYKCYEEGRYINGYKCGSWKTWYLSPITNKYKCYEEQNYFRD